MRPYCLRALLALACCGSTHAASAAPGENPGRNPTADSVPERCRAPDNAAFADGPLPRFARRLKSGDPLTVVVIGSGSAAGSGVSRKEAAFPYRLESRLAATYPKAKIKVVVLAQTGQTAPAAYARLAKEVMPQHPALVVWQTGSADAARGIPVMEFGGAIERGVSALQSKGSDVLFVDAQYSPRASLLVNTDGYRETVRWAARRFDAPLLKRYETMEYWSTNGTFDLDVEEKTAQLENADRIHDCVAALIVQLIQRGVALEPKS